MIAVLQRRELLLGATATAAVTALLSSTPAEVQETMAAAIGRDMFLATYADVYEGEDAWRELPVPTGELFEWEDTSTYVRRPPYFDGMAPAAGTIDDIDKRCAAGRLRGGATLDAHGHAAPLSPRRTRRARG